MPSSPEIHHRFEAIVVADDAAESARDARSALEPLVAAGVDVAIVGRESLADVIDELWRRGIAPTEIAVLSDTADSIPQGVARFDGGPAGMRRVLDAQLDLRRRRSLPSRATTVAWCVVLDELDDGRERVRDAIVALADGRIGIVGTVVGLDATTPRWMAAAGVYDGNGPETHLLAGPVIAPIRAGIEDRTRLRRVLDLHTGVLHEDLELVSGEHISCTRFLSKARPGTGAVRLSYPASVDADGARLVPTDTPPYDEGRTSDSAWMRVAASSGGIAAATRTDRQSSDDRRARAGRVRGVRGRPRASARTRMRALARVERRAVNRLRPDARRTAWGVGAALGRCRHRDRRRRRAPGRDSLVAVSTHGRESATAPKPRSVPVVSSGSGLPRPRVLGRGHVRPAVPRRDPSGVGARDARVPEPAPSRGSRSRTTC